MCIRDSVKEYDVQVLLGGEGDHQFGMARQNATSKRALAMGRQERGKDGNCHKLDVLGSKNL